MIDFPPQLTNWLNAHGLAELTAPERRDDRILEAEITAITSPCHLIIRELCVHHVLGDDWERDSTKTDVFVFSTGEPPRRDITKIGGLPYRERGLPWPTTPQGDRLTFIGQLSFTDSRDVFGNLPGDVLLVFAPNDEGVPEEFHYEWKPAGLTDLISKDDVPAPAWTFVTCFGTPYRTADFGRHEQRFVAEFGDRGYFFPRILGTKVGGEPMWIQPEPDVPGKFIGSIGPVQVQPRVMYPWMNQRSPLSLKEYHDEEQNMMWGDMGSLLLFLQDDGSVLGVAPCF
jgi:hypothetical protein